MPGSKDGRRSPVHPLPLDRHRHRYRGPVTRSPDVDDTLSDPVFDALHRLAEDMLDEPVPVRLLDALHKRSARKS